MYVFQVILLKNHWLPLIQAYCSYICMYVYVFRSTPIIVFSFLNVSRVGLLRCWRMSRSLQFRNISREWVSTYIRVCVCVPSRPARIRLPCTYVRYARHNVLVNALYAFVNMIMYKCTGICMCVCILLLLKVCIACINVMLLNIIKL